MNTMPFKFIIKEYFKLSTGATAFVGLTDPSDYPLITADDFVVEIKSGSGRHHIFNKISEDIFYKNNPLIDNKLRSLQTFENMHEFIAEFKSNSVMISGHKK
jgi:hypothetical protein